MPVFDGERVTLQTVRHCHQVFSAAFIAHVEADDDDAHRAKQLAQLDANRGGANGVGHRSVDVQRAVATIQ